MILSCVEEFQLFRALRARIGDEPTTISNVKDLLISKTNDSTWGAESTIKQMIETKVLQLGDAMTSDATTKRMKEASNQSQYVQFAPGFWRLDDSDEKKYILNRRRLSNSVPIEGETRKVNASEVAAQLRKRILSLYGKSLNANGSGVDYDGAADCVELVEYGHVAESLQFVDVANLENDIPDDNERKALFYNLYNALVIHGHIALGNPANIPERGVFFTRTGYDVGGELWTLDVIEHGFLRCNRRKPFANRPLLDTSDPRARHTVREPVDPRLHFALNCGAKSCPPIRFYSADKLDDQLTLAAKGFLAEESSIKIDATAKHVTLTKLLDWYGVDFGEDHRSILERILPFLEGEKHEDLKRLLANVNDVIRVEFFGYDWAENRAG